MPIDDDVNPPISPAQALQGVSIPELEIRAYLEANGLFVGTDGDIRLHEKPATTFAEIADAATAVPPEPVAVVDDLILAGSPHKPGVLKAALRKICRDDARRRHKALIESIAGGQPSGSEREQMLASFRDMVAVTFEGDPNLNTNVLLHFIYQVKRKLARLPLSDHLMPVLVSKQQGIGKTRFVKRLLEPLAELAKPMLFSDIADPRSIHVFRHTVLVIDDMEKLRPDNIPIVKNRITGDEVNGRGMRLNREVGTQQRATFIGTSNMSVATLVPDESGNRRFCELLFRNANPAAGGNPTIWPLINATDFVEVWRSVDPFIASPLDEVRVEIFGRGSRSESKSSVHAWARKLDVDSEALRRNLEREGVASMNLYDLYCEQTQDAQTSINMFGRLMKEATTDKEVPFDWPKRHARGMFFPVRRK